MSLFCSACYKFVFSKSSCVWPCRKRTIIRPIKEWCIVICRVSCQLLKPEPYFYNENKTTRKLANTPCEIWDNSYISLFCNINTYFSFDVFYAIINLKIVNFYKPWSNMKILMLFHHFDVIYLLFHDFDVLYLLFHEFDVINLSVM
jgi:hypothetical protein